MSVEMEFGDVDTEIGRHEMEGWLDGWLVLLLAMRTQRFEQLFKMETCAGKGSS